MQPHVWSVEILLSTQLRDHLRRCAHKIVNALRRIIALIILSPATYDIDVALLPFPFPFPVSCFLHLGRNDVRHSGLSYGRSTERLVVSVLCLIRISSKFATTSIKHTLIVLISGTATMDHGPLSRFKLAHLLRLSGSWSQPYCHRPLLSPRTKVWGVAHLMILQPARSQEVDSSTLMRLAPGMTKDYTALVSNSTSKTIKTCISLGISALTPWD